MGTELGLRWSACGLAAGVFQYVETDLQLPGPISIYLSRVYRSQDVDLNGHIIDGPLGVGTNFDYSLYLYSESQAASGTFTSVDLVLPNGSKIPFARSNGCSQSNCADYTDAVFTCSATAYNALFGSTVAYDSAINGWDLTRRDHTVYKFTATGLQSITDRNNNQLVLTRNAAGDVVK